MRLHSKSLILLVILAVVTACGGAGTEVVDPPREDLTARSSAAEPTEEPTEPTEEPSLAVMVVDGMGREVTLQAPPERIVSLAPSATETLFALGAGDALVGRDDFSDYPAEVEDIPSIGSTYGELNAEAILGLEPDLVLAAGITPPEHIATLDELGVPVFVIGNPADFEGLFENMLAIGELVGHPDSAQALVEDMRARYQSVTDKTEGADPVSLFYEIDASDPEAPYTTGSATFQDLMIELAGGENVASDFEGWGQISLEELVVRDPEVIVFGAGPFVPTTVESLKERPGWGDIAAVQNDRVYGIDTDLLDLVGPRLVEGLEALAQVLHPDLFSE